jgi:LytTr DNA-binding domain
MPLIRRDALPLLLAGIGPIIFCAINIWSRIHDAGTDPAAPRAWEIVTWEVSSAGMTLILVPLVAAIVSNAAGRKVGRILLLHLAASLGFWLLHVGGFILFRIAVYTLQNSVYRFGGGSAWLYELPKDLVTYAILATTIAATRALLGRPRTDLAAPAPVVIRDGKHSHFVQPDDIVAVRVVGNYLEVHTFDGRIPMMRSTMQAFANTLPSDKFLQAHRSWLFNRHHVVKLVGGSTPKLLLARDVIVPVSRRFRSGVEHALAGSSSRA